MCDKSLSSLRNNHLNKYSSTSILPMKNFRKQAFLGQKKIVAVLCFLLEAYAFIH